jgi:hypothetical protein
MHVDASQSDCSVQMIHACRNLKLNIQLDCTTIEVTFPFTNSATQDPTVAVYETENNHMASSDANKTDNIN